jgi:beta-galactosidase GanA
LEGGIRWWDQRGQEKVEAISKSAENALDIMLKIHRFQSAQMVKMSIDLMSDIKKYYPKVFKNTILTTKEQHQKRTKAFLLRGQREGIFREDVNIDLINDLFEQLMYSFIHDDNMALIRKYSYEEFFRSTAICFIRGIATEKGIKFLDEHYL